MPIITGPSLDELVKELTDWYVETREMLIKALEQGYPYGSVPLTPSEQVSNFMSMTPEDWQVLQDKLAERHRGKPNAQELVREDLEAFVAKMNRVAFPRGTV